MRKVMRGWLPFLASATFLLGCSDENSDGMWRGRIEVVAGVSRVISDAPVRHGA